MPCGTRRPVRSPEWLWLLGAPAGADKERAPRGASGSCPKNRGHGALRAGSCGQDRNLPHDQPWRRLSQGLYENPGWAAAICRWPRKLRAPLP